MTSEQKAVRRAIIKSRREYNQGRPWQDRRWAWDNFYDENDIPPLDHLPPVDISDIVRVYQAMRKSAVDAGS
jgi:hypothetical protein